MKKSLLSNAILIFFGLAAIVGSVFGMVHLFSAFYLFLALLGVILLVMGIADIVIFVKKRNRMSGTALAEEVIAEQLRYLSRIIRKKEIKKIRVDKKGDELNKEIDYLKKGYDKLIEVLN